MRRTLGYALASVLAALTLVSLMLIPLGRVLTHTVGPQQDAAAIEAQLRLIQTQSQTHYAKQVRDTQCYAQTALALGDLAATSPVGAVHYAVAYRQTGLADTAPLGIDITVTLAPEQALDTLAKRLRPERVIPPNQLRFFRPIEAGAPTLDHLTPTNCYVR